MEAETLPGVGLSAAADKVQNADLRSDIDTFLKVANFGDTCR
jgi:hypothetical protein